MFRLPFVNRGGRQPTSTSAMGVDIELGGAHGTNTGQIEHPLDNQEAAAGPLSTESNPHIQPYAGQSGNHQHQSAKRGRDGEDEPQTRSTRFVTAPDNLLQENEKRQIELAVRKEASDKYQKEIDAMKKDFQSEMRKLREEMTGKFNADLREARTTATNAQAENLAMAAELITLRARSGEGNTPQDARLGRQVERPMDVDTNRAGLSILQGALQSQQEPESPQQQALIKYGGAASDNEDFEYVEEENDDGNMQGGDEDDADDESEIQGANDEDEDMDMHETQAMLQPVSAHTNKPSGRRSMRYVEVSDDDVNPIRESDISMDEDANISAPKHKGVVAGDRGRKGQTNRIPSNSQIPRPQQFSRPHGGAGPIITIRTGPSNAAPAAPPSGTGVPSKKKGRGNERDLRRKVGQAREWHREKGTGQNSSIGSNEERASGRTHRPSRRLRVFTVVKLRGTDVNRTQLLKNVELLMNDLMDISRYDDIINVTLADDEDAGEFKKGYGNPPALEPLRPYFGRGFKKHPWNKHLEELFIRHYEDKMQVALDEEAEDMIGDMFMERVDRLRRKYRDLTKDIPDGEREAKEEEKQAKGRKNTRRVNLFDVRRKICLESIMKPDGTVDEDWKLLLDMILLLGSYGMSSDESEVDEKGYVRYNIRKRLWRSREVSDRLEVVDGARNTKNGKGKRLAGNSVRERIRSSKNPSSTRDPSIECPKNFYDPGFLRNLDNLHHRALNIKPFMELGELRF